MSEENPTTRVYIGIGSNINPEDSIARALEFLSEKVQIRSISTFYRTEALERPDQPDYLNGVVKIETDLPPLELKSNVLLNIEKTLGRVRTDDKYAPRTIDFDILVYADEVIDCPELTIPDPDITARSFVAIPLHELAPDLILPGSEEPIRTVVQDLDSKGLLADEVFSSELKGRILS